MKFNTDTLQVTQTHQWGKALYLTDKVELIKICLTSFLEKTYYETQTDIIERIQSYVRDIDSYFILQLAIFSRDYWLRSVNHLLTALWIQKEMGKPWMRIKLYNFLNKMIKRPDELWEIIAAYNGIVYTKKGKTIIPNSLKWAMSKLFENNKFSEYQLSKYKNKWFLRIHDIINMIHAKWQDKIMKWELETPNTWEVRLSIWEDKNKVFTELLDTNKLWSKAMLMNLRNMIDAWVDQNKIIAAMDIANWKGIFPFEFMKWLWEIRTTVSKPLLHKLIEKTKEWFMSLNFDGKVAIWVDTSGSMFTNMSQKSTYQYVDVAAFYWALCELCGGTVYAWSDMAKRPNIYTWDGFLSIVDKIKWTDVWYGTYPQYFIEAVKNDYDIAIMFSDGQFAHALQDVGKLKNVYVFNLASYQNTIAINGKIIEVSGFNDIMFRLGSDLNNISKLEKEIQSIKI